MRILLASDKYKGSLTSGQVGRILARALAQALPEAGCDLCPIADGGEGTTEAMVTALKGQWVEVDTVDAQNRPRLAAYGWMPALKEAVMEMSAASGLALVNDLPLKPETASTAGTGRLLRHAMALGAEKIIIGIGGSATNDGGLGLAAALGHRFLDAEGRDISPQMTDLHRLARIERSPLVFPEILVACDVDNPLLGAHGATRVYGRQKGVEDMAWFEDRLTHLAEITARDLGVDPREVPGSGAAGGLGFGLMAFCGARLTSGFDLVAAQVGLEQRMAAADLILTGEGRLDAQTLHGKGPVGVAQMARRLGKPVAAFAGVVEDSPALRQHFDFARSIKPEAMSVPEAIQRAEELLEAAVLASTQQLRALVGLA